MVDGFFIGYCVGFFVGLDCMCFSMSRRKPWLGVLPFGGFVSLAIYGRK